MEKGQISNKKNLVSVFCRKKDDIYIGGWEGALYKWNGKDHWQKIKLMSEAHSSEIFAYDLVEYLG